MADNDQALVASSEFDPKSFITGIDAMTSALERLSAQEDLIRKDLSNINTALTSNRKELKATEDQIKNLDKTSKTYNDDLAKLTTQQSTLAGQQKNLQSSMKANRDQLTEVNKSANDYKSALTGLNAISKQVAADGKGRTLFDVASMNQQIKDITTISAKYKDLFKGKIDTKELDALEDKLMSTNDDFQKLRDVIDFIQPKLAGLDPNSDAFRDLNQIVDTGRQILEDYGDVAENVQNRSQSLSSRLREVRNEMGKMVLAGEENTDQFKTLEHEAGELQDAIDKTGERVRTFANDTRAIQGGIELLRGFAAAGELVAGTTALFGIKNEAAEESIKRLTAIMAVANGLQEISNLLKKESVVRLIGEEIATKALALSQRILAITMGTTAAASRALSIALAATGIGAIVVGIGLLVAALSAWADEAKEAEKAQKLLNVATEEGIKFTNLFIDAIGDAGDKFAAEAQLRQAVNQKIVQSDIENLKSRAENAQELRTIDIKSTEEQLAEARRLERNERANYDRAADRRREALQGRIRISDEELDELGKTIENFTKIQETGYALEHQLELKRINNLRDQANDRAAIQRAELTRTDDFLKRLEELRKRLLDAQNKQRRQDADQLAKQAQDNLRSELRKIDTEVRKGQLTGSQGAVLKNLLKQINGVELATEIKEFTRKSLEAEENIQDQITALRLRVGQQRAELIRDELVAEAATIKATFAQQSQELATAQRDALKGVQDVLQQGLISPAQAEENSAQIKLVYSRLFNQLAEQQTRAQEALTAKAFEKTQQELQTVFANVQLFVSEQATAEIQKVTQRFLAGKINYEKYQKELTKINQVETERRIRTAIRENEALLEGLLARIKLEQDPGRLKTLQDQERQLRETISQLKRQLGQAEAQGLVADRKAFADKVQNVANYATAINNVVQSVVGFWDQANRAEQAQLDRSIAIQEKRVDAATRIAERGNAEYLRLEEDRLNELRLKQENAARRQLAINAVLQTSQALTAFITALAQGIATGGPLGGLAIAAAVLGAIASGYAIVQSLQQNNTQELWEGTTSVQRGKAKKGKDTVPAMLTEGEAVLPVDVNQDYHDTVEAMYGRKIPAREMNNFVNSYRVNRRTIPSLNNERIGETADMMITYDGKLLEATEKQTQKLAENAELLKNVDKSLKNLGISVNIDKNGLAISLMKALHQANIDKKA
jgi:predicted  nucleic acid-binding Zn-ribbon protein